MSYQWNTNRRPGLPPDAQGIHTVDCPCSDCKLDRRRNHLDGVQLLVCGAGSALVAVAALNFGPAALRAIEGLF